MQFMKKLVTAVVAAVLLSIVGLTAFAQESADRSVAAAPTLDINVTATPNFGFMGKAVFVPPGTTITVTWKSTGATKCNVSDGVGLNGSQQIIATESLNIAGACSGPSGTVKAAFNVVVNNAGTIGVCEGALTAQVGEEVKFFFTASKDFKVKWSGLNADFGTSDPTTQMGYQIPVKFTKAGTQTVIATSESGVVGRCQIQVLGPQGVGLTPTVVRNDDGSLTVQVGAEALPEGSFAVSQANSLRSRGWPFSNPTFSYTLHGGVAAGESATIPVPIPADWRQVDVKFTSSDGATSFSLRLQ